MRTAKACFIASIARCSPIGPRPASGSRNPSRMRSANRMDTPELGGGGTRISEPNTDTRTGSRDRTAAAARSASVTRPPLSLMSLARPAAVSPVYNASGPRSEMSRSTLARAGRLQHVSLTRGGRQPPSSTKNTSRSSGTCNSTSLLLSIAETRYGCAGNPSRASPMASPNSSFQGRTP